MTLLESESVPTVGSVEDGRRHLDDVDAEICRLIQRRRALSTQVQALRRAAGGPRVEHARENQIVSGYAGSLGKPGVSVALAVLDYCRGERPDRGDAPKP